MGYLSGVMVLFISIFVFSFFQVANAVPAFARQMGVSCMTCHAQDQFPALNSFGRKFKASGFTIVGNQKLIEEKKGKSSFMSLPSNLNASVIAVMAYSKSGGETGEFAIPDELALVIGGRVAKNVGTFIEMGYENDESKISLGNVKIPIVFDFANQKFGVVPFLTDGMGPSFAFEVLNTGAVENHAMVEAKDIISAQQYIGTGTEAEGLGFYLYNDLYNVVYSAWVPKHEIAKISSPSHYLRLAVTPQFKGWDLGFGGQIWFGKAKIKNNDGSKTLYRTNAYAVDFQAMGNMVLPLTVTLTYGNARNESFSIYNDGSHNKEALTAFAEVGAIPDKFLVSLGYRNAKNENNKSDDAELIALKYMLSRNIQIQFDYDHLNLDSINEYEMAFISAF